MNEATEYRGPDGERLYLQMEIAEGDNFVENSMLYSMRNADRVVGVRLLLEQRGVKYIWRLCPQGHTVLEARQEDWDEPVKQYAVVREAQTIVINPPHRACD